MDPKPSPNNTAERNSLDNVLINQLRSTFGILSQYFSCTS